MENRTLVLLPHAAPVPASRELVPVGSASLRVLVIDDDAGVRAVLGRVLRHYGFDAVLHTHVDAAALGSHEEFDCVVVDVPPPGVFGRRVLAEAAMVQQDTPLVLMTGVSVASLKSRIGVPAGAPALQKPFAMSRLRDAVLQAVAGEQDAQIAA